MATYEFDAFQDSIGSAVDEAQKSIDRKNQGRLQRLFEEGKDGKTELVTWICNVPSGKGGEDCERISLPLLSLRSSQSFRVAEVSFGFDAEVEAFKGKEEIAPETDKNDSRPSRLVMWLRKWMGVPRRGLVRFKVICKGGEALGGEVSVNGQRLKKFKCNNE